MARARFDNLEPERQETILAAAAGEFAAHGYAGASLNRIIEAAGISKGSLYYYFDDKADLFASVMEVAMERFLGETGRLSMEDLDRTNFWDTMLDMALQSADALRRDEWYVPLILAFPRLREEPETGPSVEPLLEWASRFTTELVGRGRELGVVRRDLPLDLLVEITMAVDEVVDRWTVEHLDEYQSEPALRKLIAAQVDLARDMLDARNEGWEQ